MPVLQRMIDLRNTLGLRSPIYSLVRLLDPLNADCILQSIFHPGYQGAHREVNHLLGDRVIIIKGESGEVEVDPDVIAHLYGCDQGKVWDEEQLALPTHRHIKPKQLDPDFPRVIWDDCEGSTYGHLAVLSSMASTLRAPGKNREEAFKRAIHYWATQNESI